MQILPPICRVGQRVNIFLGKEETTGQGEVMEIPKLAPSPTRAKMAFQKKSS